MKAIILGGESSRHKAWVRQVAGSLRGSFDAVEFLDYEHWATDESEIDLEREISRASALVESSDDYVIIAKSIGTIIATLAISRGLLRPKHCVFLGFPLGATSKIPGIDIALSSLPPTDFVHNEFDKVGTAEAVMKYLHKNNSPIRMFKTVVGNYTHDYTDLNLVKLLATNELKDS